MYTPFVTLKSRDRARNSPHFVCSVYLNENVLVLGGLKQYTRLEYAARSGKFDISAAIRR